MKLMNCSPESPEGLKETMPKTDSGIRDTGICIKGIMREEEKEMILEICQKILEK